MNKFLRDIINNQTTRPTVDDVTTSKLTKSTLVTNNGSGYESSNSIKGSDGEYSKNMTSNSAYKNGALHTKNSNNFLIVTH